MDPDTFLGCLFVLSVLEFGASLTLLLKALKWMKQHPTGADPGWQFTPLLVVAPLVGIALVVLLVAAGFLPSYDLLSGKYGAPSTSAYIDLMGFVLACLPCLSMLGWHPKVSRKANLVAFLAALNLLFLPCAFVAFCHALVLHGP